MAESDSHETPIHETTREGINVIPEDGYKVDDDRIPAPKNKPSATGKNDQPVFK